jgi:hypothetical protein
MIVNEPEKKPKHNYVKCTKHEHCGFCNVCDSLEDDQIHNLNFDHYRPLLNEYGVIRGWQKHESN